MASMQALVFKGPGQIELREKPIPRGGADRCADPHIDAPRSAAPDVHILKGEYPVKPG